MGCDDGRHRVNIVVVIITTGLGLGVIISSAAVEYRRRWRRCW